MNRLESDQMSEVGLPDSAEAALERIFQQGNRWFPRGASDRWRDPNWFLCGDGSKVSIIAGWGTYCHPRPDWPTEWGGVAKEYAGPYDAVEAWLPGEDDPKQIAVDELRTWIADHGGVVAVAESESELKPAPSR